MKQNAVVDKCLAKFMVDTCQTFRVKLSLTSIILLITLTCLILLGYQRQIC
jgi:hypothetical protein